MVVIVRQDMVGKHYDALEKELLTALSHKGLSAAPRQHRSHSVIS